MAGDLGAIGFGSFGDAVDDIGEIVGLLFQDATGHFHARRLPAPQPAPSHWSPNRPVV
jgi:hypothetical protein